MSQLLFTLARSASTIRCVRALCVAHRLRVGLMFCALISSLMIGQVLYEDGKTNRMDESLRLFEETVSNKYFQNTSFILFLNKRDLFEDKIKQVPLTAWGGAANMPGDPKNKDDAIAFVQSVRTHPA